MANERLGAPLASVLAEGVSGVSLCCCFSSSFLPSAVQFQCCFTSTDTVRTVRGRGAQDGHLHFHTAPDLWNHGLQVLDGCSLCVIPASVFNVLMWQSWCERRKIATDNKVFWIWRYKFNIHSFTSTETVLRTIRDGEPRTSTSTFTQLLSSESGFSVALRPQRLFGLSGTGSPGRPPRL